MIVAHIIVLAASFIVVFLLGLQSRNVNQGRYIAAVITSAGIAVSQFYFVKIVATGTVETLLFSLIGGCAGIAFSIWFHQHVIERKRNAVPQAGR